MNMSLIEVALLEYGEREVPGASDNPQILQMARDCAFIDYVHDSTAWCSLFANWVCWKVALERSKSLAARSWLDAGVAVDTPEQADIVVFWRIDPKGTLGHVGFPICRRNGLLYVLGGNQQDQVMIEGFGMDKALGYRKLRQLTL